MILVNTVISRWGCYMVGYVRRGLTATVLEPDGNIRSDWIYPMTQIEKQNEEFGRLSTLTFLSIVPLCPS
jgi:hypothetical protein